MALLEMHFKLLAGVAALLSGSISYVPYFSAIFKKETKPHPYTWLVWAITTGTAAFGVYWSGGGYAAFVLFCWTGLTFLTFLLSLRYGTKNITRFDAVCLFLAFLGIVLWWLYQNPFLGILMATVVDAIGYLPTYRKSFAEPWSESVLSWSIFVATTIFTLLALSIYTPTTVMYSAMSLVANLLIVLLCLLRRRSIPKPV